MDRIQARRFLEEMNHFLLDGQGDILEAPGKMSLVWTDPASEQQHYLAVKPAGDEYILVNGRRYPATESGLKQGLVASMREQKGTA